jgi:hypothetical protein
MFLMNKTVDDGTYSSLARYEVWCMFMGVVYYMMKPLPFWGGLKPLHMLM